MNTFYFSQRLTASCCRWRRVLPAGLLSSLLTAAGPTQAGIAAAPFPGLAAADSGRTAAVVPAKRHVVKFSPFSLLAGHLSVFYEQSFSPRWSVVAGAGGMLGDLTFRRIPEKGAPIYRRATLEVRRNLEKSGPRGLYAGAYLRLSQLRETHFVPDPPTQHYTGYLETQETLIWIPGVMVGHQLVGKWFVLDTFLGLQQQLVVGTVSRSNQLVEAMTTPTVLRIGINVGVPF